MTPPLAPRVLNDGWKITGKGMGKLGARLHYDFVDLKHFSLHKEASSISSSFHLHPVPLLSLIFLCLSALMWWYEDEYNPGSVTNFSDVTKELKHFHVPPNVLWNLCIRSLCVRRDQPWVQSHEGFSKKYNWAEIK